MSASQFSISSVSQRIADQLQKVIDEVRALGRFSHRRKSKPVSDENRAEDNLCRRVQRARPSIPEDVWKELEALSNTTVEKNIPMRASGYANSGASQPTEDQVQKVIHKESARTVLQQNNKPVSAENRAEDNLCQRLQRAKPSITENVW